MSRIPGQRVQYQGGNERTVVQEQVGGAPRTPVFPAGGRRDNANWPVRGAMPQPGTNITPPVVMPKNVGLNGTRPVPHRQLKPGQEPERVRDMEPGPAFWSSTPRVQPGHGKPSVESKANDARLNMEKQAYDRLFPAGVQQTTVEPHKDKGNSFANRLGSAMKQVISRPVKNQTEEQKRLKEEAQMRKRLNEMKKKQTKHRRWEAQMAKDGV